MRSPLRRKPPTAYFGDEAGTRRSKPTTQELVAANKGPGFVVTGLRTLAGLALALVIGAGIWFGAAALEGDDPSPLAPWNSPSAPSVAPEPLGDQ